ncbi:Dephospho-CoA kinase [hydrothermal vent metagenome]|uniref:Dephospho-CoA kinase n=1 Tax=hydrothermal vent metagenome TaxID=652676 RepID=A0A3B1BKL3_9ZZZZ
MDHQLTNNNILAIGLTGGIGSGKTQVSDHFAKLGAQVIDTDVIARELVVPTQPALTEIATAFGQDILTPQGRLDRGALRRLIFDQSDKRRQLENILHPRIRTEVRNRLHQLGSPWCIIVIPLLQESAQQDLVQRILLVDAPTELQLSRTMLRDNVAADEVMKIIASQASRQSRLKLADDVIVNEGSLEQLWQQVEQMYQFYNQLADGCQNH